MAEFTLDDVLSFLKNSVRPYNGNDNAPPVARDINPSAKGAFREPYRMAKSQAPSMASSMDAETGMQSGAFSQPDKGADASGGDGIAG